MTEKYKKCFGNTMQFMLYEKKDFLLHHNITLEDSIYIAWLVANMNEYPNRLAKIDGKVYYWVEYSAVSKELIFPNISKKNLNRVIGNKFQSLVDKGVLESHLIKGRNPINDRRGSFTFYKFND